MCVDGRELRGAFTGTAAGFKALESIGRGRVRSAALGERRDRALARDRRVAGSAPPRDAANHSRAVCDVLTQDRSAFQIGRGQVTLLELSCYSTIRAERVVGRTANM